MQQQRRSFQAILVLTALSITLWGCSDQGLFGGSDGSKEAFEGSITYEVDHDLPPERQNMAAMLPDQELVHIKEGKTRWERVLTLGIEMALIQDPAKDSLIQLIDPQGMKRIGPSRIPRELDTTERSFEYTDETETITVEYMDETDTADDGTDTVPVIEKDYPCKKAVLVDTVRGNEVRMPVWYTEAIEGSPFPQFKDLKGYPLRFKSEANGFTVEKTASKVRKRSLSDSLFDDQPEGYKTRSVQEFREMMGAGRR